MVTSTDRRCLGGNLSSRYSGWLGLLLVGGVFVIVTALSWRRWPDILVDFGMQLYLPWRISEGEVLYRDVAYLPGGPFSQYFNAMLFKVFGVSFRTLIFANLTITAGMVVLIYRRFLAVADQLTATIIGLGIVLVFAFQHGMRIGNYNYVTPYCHEVFHGLMLSILVVIWLSDWVATGKIKFAVAAGFGSGLVFMTKPDVFLALAVGAATALAVAGRSRPQIVWAIKSLGVFLLAGLVPLLVFFAWFLRAESWPASAGAVAAAWVPLWHAAITRDPFYQWCLGLDTPFLHLEKMAGQFVFVAVIIAVCALVFREAPTSRFEWVRSFRALRPLLMLPLLISAAMWDWVDCGRSLPLLALVAGGLLTGHYRKAVAGPAAIFPLLWIVFGLALMAKLGFYPRVWHYGFVLAMPAFAGAVYLFVWLLPLWLERKYRVNARWFRLTVCLVLLIGFVRLFIGSETFYLKKDAAIGNAGDKIMAYGPHTDDLHDRVRTALSWIETNVPPAATLAVVPEGAMINYLSRRVNPTPCPVWLPPEVKVYGQTNMAAAFEKNRPDYIVIIARSASEYGMGFFGHDPRYGADLRRWIEDHYDRLYPAPDPAVQLAGEKAVFYGMQILKRREADFPQGKL